MMVSLLALAGLATAATAQDNMMQELAVQDAAYFSTPVCPGVGGLSADLSIAILEEARALLDANGVELGVDGECAPNLFIIVSGDPGEAIRSLRSRQPTVFNQMSGPDFRALADGGSPARSFRSAITKGEDGRELRTGGGTVLAQGGSEGSEQLATTRASRIGGTTRRDVEQSFVYLDANAIKGLTLRQIGHYAAVVGVMPVDVARGAAVDQPSILKLFADKDNAPAEATDFDKALLRSGR